MILAIDVGNSNIVMGCIEEGSITNIVRLHTERSDTSEEYAIKLEQIFSIYGVDYKAFEGAIISSPVPEVTDSLRNAVRLLTGIECMVLGPGIKTGMNIRIDDPGTVGADLIAGTVGALCKYGAPVIVADLGTATTLIAVDKEGSFRGGAIIPGIKISYRALAAGTSLLPSISISAPKKVISTNTTDCMCSGAVYGSAAMIDGLVDRMEEELGYPCKVVATGGLAPNVVACCKRDIICDANLILEGLWYIYKKNR